MAIAPQSECLALANSRYHLALRKSDWDNSKQEQQSVGLFSLVTGSSCSNTEVFKNL